MTDIMGMLTFHCAVKVTAAEMASWSADRIAAFFAGSALAKRAHEGRWDELPRAGGSVEDGSHI